MLVHFSLCSHSLSYPTSMLRAGDTKANKTNIHGPCSQGAHILVEERDNEKVTNQEFPDFHKCSEETLQNVELEDNRGKLLIGRSGKVL